MVKFGIAMVLSIGLSVWGDLMVKEASVRKARSGQPGSVLRQPLFLFALLLLTGQFVGFIGALRWGPVTLVVPLMSCTYVLTTIVAHLILREKVTVLRWSGVGVIILGVVILGSSSISSRPERLLPAPLRPIARGQRVFDRVFGDGARAPGTPSARKPRRG